MREKVSIGLIRVITLDDEDSLNVHGKIIEENFPLLRVVSRCIMGFPKGLYNLELERKAIPQIVNLALEFEKEGMKAVIISCADDPGVKEARKRVKIPVIGPCESSLTIASQIGTSIMIVEILPETIPLVKRLIRKYGYYGTDKTFYRTNDSGKTWTTKSLPSTGAATSLLIDFDNPQTIYLGITKLKK